MSKNPLVLILVALVLLIVVTQGFFTVHQTQKALVLQLGEPLSRVYGPGLHFKIPFIQNVVYFDARVLDYEARSREAFTVDKKAIVLDNYARWKIIDPLQFYRTMRSIPGAQARLDDVVYSQLRALVRASSYGNLAIMIPLITGIEEYRKVKEIITGIMREFDKQEIPYDKNLKIGVMVETPAAAVCADILAKEVDFFSIGTNDLIGYTLAVDRGNANVEYLYSAFSPAVLRLIRNIITEAKKTGIPVGMCGEAAADPMMIPLLISFGLNEFSVTPTSILATRREIARWTKVEADKVAEQIMSLDTEQKVASVLAKLTAK